MKLTNNEGVDVAVDTTYSTSSFIQSANSVKKGGKWICVTTVWGEDHKKALGICESRGVAAQSGDYGRYWALPDVIPLAEKHTPHMLESCDKLYASGVHVKVTKVIPMELAPMKEEVLAVGESKRCGKVIVEIAGDK